MPQKFANNISLTTSLALTASSSLTGFTGLSASVTAPDISADGDYFLVTLTDGTDIEIVKVYDEFQGAFSITRAQEGTTAQAWPSGTTAEIRLTAAPLDHSARTNGTFDERYIKYPVQYQEVINSEYIGSSTKETIFPGGGTTYANSLTNENTFRLIHGEDASVSSRVSTQIVLDIIVRGSGTSTGYSSKSSASLSVELQLAKPGTYTRPYVGEATRYTTFEWSSTMRVYYISGDVRHALFPNSYATSTGSFVSGIPFEFITNCWYDSSTQRTYFVCSAYGGTSLGTGSGISIYADIFKGVSNGGYKTYTHHRDNARIMNQTNTYHGNKFVFPLGNWNQEVTYKIRVGKRSTSSWNASFYIDAASKGISIERKYSGQ